MLTEQELRPSHKEKKKTTLGHGFGPDADVNPKLVKCKDVCLSIKTLVL